MSTHSDPGTRRSSRARTLTQPGKELYEKTVSKYYAELKEIKHDLDESIQEIQTAKRHKGRLKASEKFIDTCSCISAYLQAADRFLEFLYRTRSVESDTEIAHFKTVRDTVKAKVDVAKSKIDDYLQQLTDDESDRHSSVSASSRDSKSSSKSKIRDYINSLDSCLHPVHGPPGPSMLNPTIPPVSSQAGPSMLNPTIPPVSSQAEPSILHATALPVLNPAAQPFVPSYIDPGQHFQLMDTFTRHLVKRDLIMSRLSKYDDDPMMFVCWKTTFRGIIGATPTEELELLCQKLGPDSSKQAKTIKACNASNPSEAISKIWERLDKRFGAPEMVEKCLHKRIKDFPDITVDKYHLLYDLLDLATEVASIKSRPRFSILLAYFDSKIGVNQFVEKLPWSLKEKWITEATRYKQLHNVIFPPYSVFVTFLEKMADMKNDPAFQFEKKGVREKQTRQNVQPAHRRSNFNTAAIGVVNTKRTATVISDTNSTLCPLHKNGKHVLNNCVPFRQKPIGERKKIILTNGICFRCCSGPKHRAKNCKTYVKCSICESTSHPTALHEDIEQVSTKTTVQHLDTKHYEGETTPKTVASSCTQISGISKSCAKIVPVRIHHNSNPDKVLISYATIDDQSNQSLATTSFFNYFGDCSADIPYTLVSCSGSVTTAGRMGTGYIVRPLDESCELSVPHIIECNELPGNRDEIPTSDIALQYPHLQNISSQIPPIMDSAGMDLLIGRDVIHAHVVQEQIVGEKEQPFAQRLPLGWVIDGHICLGGAHVPQVKTLKTFILNNGRPSNFQQCDSEISVYRDLFRKTEHDEKLGMSIEDREFLQVMDSSFIKDVDGHWVAPLPFKRNRNFLPSNRPQALRRAISFDKSLHCDPVKSEHVVDFMQKLFDKGHVEKAPELPKDVERWYLPMFGVYHPKKPGSIRVVFDSSARYEGTSLNDVVLKGPDLANNLQGILLRFRKEKFAVLADVEQMFHNFRVTEKHRDYLRFLWHADNNLQNPLEEFRMTVHVFGNKPSPAVANYGMHRCVENADSDVKEYVCRNFYVDDGLMSFSSVEKAVDVVKRTQRALFEGGRLRLHKISSNSMDILKEFPNEDLAKDLKDLDFGLDYLPEQRSLGITWDIMTDTFMFRVNDELKPFTRRGVLSVINSLFDPIGFTAPVTIEGKLLLRETMSSPCDWDDPLPDAFRLQWEKWVEALSCLQEFSISRTYCLLSIECSSRIEIHIFSDASREAVAAVAFIKVFSADSSEVGFLLGKAKVAPAHGHTIPRLELCAAVLGVEIAEIVQEQLCLERDVFRFYTDSNIVLGYISNDSKRFHVYVANRVNRIRTFCGPDSWRHVTSEENPADIATRGCSARDLSDSLWIRGPSFLLNDKLPVQLTSYDLVYPEDDIEVRKSVTCVKTSLELPRLGCERFERFSSWSSLVRALICLKRVLARKTNRQVDNVDIRLEVERFIIQQVQCEKYWLEINVIRDRKKPSKNSSLLPLNPILDQNGILRVGGRVKGTKNSVSNSNLSIQPIIIPKGHHIGKLLVRHFHAKVHHQGRHLTEGAIRSGNYWIVGGRRTINTVIQQCITCRKLRGKLGWTKMADLPPDRLESSPPFTFVGVDVFGPWPIVIRRTTRGVITTSKCWGVLFTCLVSRAAHVELVIDMSSSSFINALRRFIAIRGPVCQFRSDRGSNFLGAVKELGIDASFIEEGPVRDYLTENGTKWIFNPPYAHHFGGVWERLIGSCRRILDAILLENRSKNLTFETLSTFMAEVCAVLNARPLVPLSSDPELPLILSPSQLLTQKVSDFTGNHEVSAFCAKGAMKSQWKLVQFLANNFWRRWRSEYIHQLQIRRKWQLPGETFKVRDVILLKDDDIHRNQWPLGVVEEVYPSEDSIVRKVKVSVIRGDKRVSYVRPISELVRLVEFE